ncbi:MAG: hypothetical protein JNM14_07705 [Ferruginibacter sp.]|nr:hypothetical protein [Ferruginibacter sp.]
MYKFIFLLLFTGGIGVFGLQAQELNINGDTIFVNTEAEIMVRFPTLPTYFNTQPPTAPYNLKTAGTGFTITSKAEKTKSAPLTVMEGGRTHKFILVFKKNINYNNDAEMDYDFSTVKKLEQHIRSLSLKKPGSKTDPESLPVAKEDKKEKPSKKDKAAENAAANYYALLETGDNFLKDKKYLDAKLSFEKASALRPADQIPKQRLDEIRIRLEEQEKAVTQAKNKQYSEIIAIAKTNLNAKKYDKAQENYRKALELVPGDNYATHQLEKIDELINSEKGKKEQQRLEDLYAGYIADGDKALKKNDLDDARLAFEQALVIKQNDVVAVSKLKLISEKEKQEREKADAESKYNTIVDNADKLYKAGYLEEAKVEYTRAKGLSKKNWPDDQLKKIARQQATIAKETADKQKSAKDTKAAEKAKLETAYNEAIKSADNFFAEKNFVNAAIAYNEALKIDKRDWPASQLNTIRKIQEAEEAESKKTAAAEKETAKQVKEKKRQEEKEKQDREKEYKALIKEADRLFDKKDYEAAKTEYVKASALSNDKKPLDQIAAINKIFADQKEKEEAEKLRLAKEAEINSNYATFITRANTELDQGRYLNARKLYADAALIKPSEKLPGEKIKEIDVKTEQLAAAEKAKKDSIATAAELKKKYSLVMSKARSYYLKQDYTNAKNEYTEALRLKPQEAEPKTQLKAIEDKLNALAKANEIDDKYDQKVALGDSLLIAKSYDKAIDAYKAALAIKPGQYYPQKQITYSNAEIRNQQKENEDRAKLELYQKQKEIDKNFHDALKRADQAVVEKNYAAAKAAYIDALAIRPDHDYAKRRLEIVNYQLEKESIAVAEPPKKDTKKKESKTPVVTDAKNTEKLQEKRLADSLLQAAAPLPYSPEELKAKYPGIDFTKLPPEQPFNDAPVNSSGKATFIKDILPEARRLDLSASQADIKVTCQGINFEGTNVYFKFLVKNNSGADFLTGSMMVTWTKRAGNRIKLYPVYLYPAILPVITAKKEATIIYVCKSYYINDQEKLNFELNDRLNKIKMEIEIPGTVYNEEESR